MEVLLGSENVQVGTDSKFLLKVQPKLADKSRGVLEVHTPEGHTQVTARALCQNTGRKSFRLV